MNSDPVVFARVSLGPRTPQSSEHFFALKCRPLRATPAFLEFVGVLRVIEYMKNSHLLSDLTLERSSLRLVFLTRVSETAVQHNHAIALQMIAPLGRSSLFLVLGDCLKHP